jgi:hypothetical protein
VSIPEAVRSKAWVCCRSLVGNPGSNPAGGIDVCVLVLYRTDKRNSQGQ